MRWLFNIISIAALAVSLVCMVDMVGRYCGTSYLQKTTENASAVSEVALRYGFSGWEAMRKAMDELTEQFENFIEDDERSHPITTGEES